MRSPSTSLALLAPLLLAAQGPGSSSGPPGLLTVRGGRTRIGSTVAEVEALIRAKPELSLAVAGEAPQFTMEVEDFLLMPTEVTNEQYLVYVKATGARPPRSWGARALRDGQAAFLDEEMRARQEAQRKGQPYEAREFDPAAWWNDHWHDVAWEVQPAEIAHPVVYVAYADAQAYARWAGLRLMSEFEFQRAGRGDTTHVYPWGDEWDDRRFCQSLHSGRDSTAAVGSFPDGAVGGIHDLSGNVWEWTSSPFDPYPGYKPLRVELKDRVVEAFGPFSPEQRVVVGGSFQMDKTGVRLAIRKYTDPTQATSALGFRCAASVAPGLDAAQWIAGQSVLFGSIAREAQWSPRAAAVRRRWTSTEGTVKVAGYRLITRYEHFLACPVAALAASNQVDLATTAAQAGALPIAFLDLPFAVTDPALPAGTHLVAWHGAEAGPRPSKRTKNAAFDGHSLEEVPGFRADADCFVLYDASGTAEIALPAPPVAFSREKPGRIELASDAAGGDSATFSLCIPSARTASKGFFFELTLHAPAQTFGPGWE